MLQIEVIKILSCSRTRDIVLQILGEDIPLIDLSKLDQRLIPLLLTIAKHEALINVAESEIEKVLNEDEVEMQHKMYT